MKLVKISFLFSFGVLLIFTNSINVTAQKETLHSKILAQWEMSFNTNHGIWFQSPVGISRKSDGSIVAAVLSSTWIKFAHGVINGKSVSLVGNSPYGAVKIEAKLVNNQLWGKWHIGADTGELRGLRINPVNKTAVSPLKIFDFVRSAIDKQFYDPQFNGADWKRISARYRRQAANARSETELVTLIRNMFGEIGTSHLDFYREATVNPSNSASEQKSGKASTPYSVQTPDLPVVWKELSSKIGYIQIKRFDEGKAAVDLIDQAFAVLGSHNSLIIDLRGNEGGTLSIGMRLCDYLFQEMRPLGYLATRAGLDRSGIKSLSNIRAAGLSAYNGYNVDEFLKELKRSGVVMLESGGRAPQIYRGHTVVLINERSGSATEAYAGVIKESGVATLIGQRTAGAMLSSTKVNVPGGWTLLLPEADFITAGGMRIEGKGVEPNIFVKSEDKQDTVLKQAVEFLKDY